MKKISLLRNSIQEYAWGSKTFIPHLLGEPAPSRNPQAELWMGAHPKAVSRVIGDDKEMELSEWIQEDPFGVLGAGTAEKFSHQLPFLFKVLASQKPLSIQAHPNKEQASKGFDTENRMNIPLDADNRNYKDDNHKPELICALEPFTALKGFRDISEIVSLMGLTGIPAQELGIDILANLPDHEGLRLFFHHLMSIPKDLQSRIINRTLVHLDKQPTEIDPAIEWIFRLHEEYPGDMGVLSPLFLNLIQLQPQEAMFIPAGELHAYLEGVGLEIMANSDNVLRGGLTPKHVDVPELCGILKFEPGPISTLNPEFDAFNEGFYRTPAEEFTLSIISLRQGIPYDGDSNRSVEIIICMKGDARIKDLKKGTSLSLSKGVSIIIPAAVKQYRIEGEATVYKAGVPLQ